MMKVVKIKRTFIRGSKNNRKVVTTNSHTNVKIKKH